MKQKAITLGGVKYNKLQVFVDLYERKEYGRAIAVLKPVDEWNSYNNSIALEAQANNHSSRFEAANATIGQIERKYFKPIYPKFDWGRVPYSHFYAVHLDTGHVMNLHNVRDHTKRLVAFSG